METNNKKTKLEHTPNEIHWWDFPDNIYVLLEDNYRKTIFDKPLYGIAKKLNNSRSTVLGWSRGKWKNKVQFMPIWALKKLHEIYNLDYYVTEWHIVSYREANGNIIKNPKLPIKESPELFQIIGHLYADGYGGDVKGAIPNYCNTSVESRKEFVNLLKYCFGDVPINEFPKFHLVTFSKAIARIIKKFYEIEDFRALKSKVPQSILTKSDILLSAIIKAFIIDEASIRDPGIDIFCANYALITDLKTICIKLGYSTGPIRMGQGVFYLKIYSKSLVKLSKDIGKLPHKEKQWKLELQLSIKNRDWFFQKRGKTREEILSLLKEKPRTVYQLCRILNISTKSIRDFHLYKMENEGLVKRSKLDKEHIWSLA